MECDRKNEYAQIHAEPQRRNSQEARRNRQTERHQHPRAYSRCHCSRMARESKEGIKYAEDNAL